MIEPFLVLGAFGALFGWVSTNNVRARLAARSKFKSLPMLTPDSPDGATVKVVGKVRALEHMVAPLSGTPCVAYHVETNARAGTKKRQGPPIIEERTVLFALDRGDEPSVIVDGSHAMIDNTAEPKKSFTAERKEHFLVSNGVTSTAFNPRFSETIIAVGAEIAVSGTVMHDAPLEAAMNETHFRDEAPPTIRIAGNAEHPLVVSVRR